MGALVNRGDAFVSVAVSPTAATIAVTGAPRPSVEQVAIAPDAGENGSWPGLDRVFERVAAEHPGARITVALLPPLVEVRRLDLPPVSEQELQQLLARNPGRYFLAARGSQTIAVQPQTGRMTMPLRLRGNGASAPRGVLAAAAPSRLLGAMHGAAGRSGVTIAGVTAAEGAWAAVALAFWPQWRRQEAFLLVHEGERTALLALDRGRVVNVRRFRPGDTDAEAIAEAIRSGANHGTEPLVGAIGTAAARAALTRALGERGITVCPVPDRWKDQADSSAALAAVFAPPSAGPMLLSEGERIAARARNVRATLVVAAMAAAFLLAAPLVALWGVHRELNAVERARAELRPEVAATLIGRTSVEDAYHRLESVVADQRTAPHWASVLADLSERLPDDAYLTTVRTRGDSLVIDGLAPKSAAVFAAVSAAPDLANVRAPAPVRRLAPEGGAPMERFTLAAILRHREGSDSATPDHGTKRP